MSLLIKRLAEGNARKFAREIGTESGVIAHIVGGRMSKPSFQLLTLIANRYPLLNTKWLLTGEGEMLLDGKPTPELDEAYEKLREKEELIDTLLEQLQKERKRNQQLEPFRKPTAVLGKYNPLRQARILRPGWPKRSKTGAVLGAVGMAA